MKKNPFLFLLCSIVFLGSACTTTPPKGDDLLDTGYNAPHQDPVVYPKNVYSSTVPAHGVTNQNVVTEKETSLHAPQKTDAPLSLHPAPSPVVKKEAPKEIKPQTKAANVEKSDEKAAVAPEAEIKTVSKSSVKTAPAPMPAPPKISEKKSLICQDGKIISPFEGKAVRIDVKGEKDLSKEYKLNEKGEIDFPLIGKIQAAGITSAAFQKNLADKLGAGYLVKPDVHVQFIGCE